MKAAHPMDHPFQLPREFHTDLMSPSLLSAMKQPRGPYGTPVVKTHMHIIKIVMTIINLWIFFVIFFLYASLNFRILQEMSEGENMGSGEGWND